MFTGIIEEIGTVRSIRGGGSGVVLDIEASRVLEGTATGDSIAVNGVCLTVTPGSGHFTADAARRSIWSGPWPAEAVSADTSSRDMWMPADGWLTLCGTALPWL